MEQKMFKTFDYSDQTSSSASKAESQLGHLDLNPNVHSAIEFKKKKNLESPATPPSLKPQQSRPEQCSRFNPKASTPESKPE
jgi:phage portal protein BeeE